MSRRIITSLAGAVALGLIFAPAANAARPHPLVNATFVLQAPPEVTTAPDAAAAWSKNTGVEVVLGSCSGPRCIVVEVVETTICDASAPVGGVVLGCRDRQADGSDLIQLRAGMLFDGYHFKLQRAVLEHEAGHAMGLPHSDDTRSLMYPVIDSYDPPSGPTAQDRSNLSALYQ